MGLLSLRNWVSQLLIINLYIYLSLSLSLSLVLFLWEALSAIIFHFVSEGRLGKETYSQCCQHTRHCAKEPQKWLVLFINEKKLRNLNIIKLAIIPKVIFGFNAIPLKILTGSFTDLDDMTSKSFVKIERQ